MAKKKKDFEIIGYVDVNGNASDTFHDVEAEPQRQTTKKNNVIGYVDINGKSSTTMPEDQKIRSVASTVDGLNTINKKIKEQQPQEQNKNVQTKSTIPSVAEKLREVDPQNDTLKFYEDEEYKNYYNSLNDKQKVKENQKIIKMFKKDFDKENTDTSLEFLQDKDLKKKLLSGKELTTKDKEKMKGLDKANSNKILFDYLDDYYKESNKKTTTAEKILTAPLTGIKGLATGPASLIGYKQITREDGLKYNLPDTMDIRSQRVKEDINNPVGRLAYDVAQGAAPIVASTLIPGGEALYWGSMYGNAQQQAVNQLTEQGKQDNGKSYVNAALQTGLEYATGKFLGSATKGLTGGKTSELEKAISNKAFQSKLFQKLPENMRVAGADIIGKIGSEGTEEFSQEYLGNIVDILTLGTDGEHNNILDMIKDPDVFSSAMYAGLVGGATGGALAPLNGEVNVTTNRINQLNLFKSALQEDINTTTNKSKQEKLQEIVNNIDKTLQNPFSIEENTLQGYENDLINQNLNIQQLTQQVQPELSTQTPLNTLSSNIQEQSIQTPYQEQTPQITPLNQVNQELQETRQQDVADSVRAMNLEQEPQFTQKQGNYVYEKSDNSKIDNLRKDAANYLKEGEQTTNFVNTLEKLVKDKNVDIRFNPNLRDSQGRIANGSYSNGVITLNPNSNRAGEFLAIHELTHAIGTKSMINMIQKYRKSNAEFDSAVKRLLTTYKATEINEEALGDIAGQLFGNQEYINNLSMENPSLFKRIYNEIKYLWHKFTGYKNQDQFIEDLKNKWESAYRNQKIQQKAKNSNIEMSNQVDSTGNKLSQDQVNYFKDSKVRDENGNLLEMYHGTAQDFNEFTDKFMGQFQGNSLGYGHYFTTDYNTANTYRQYAKGEGYGKVMKEYLNITSPFNLYPNMNQDGDLLNKAEYLMTKYDVPGIDKNNIAYETHLDYVKGKLNKNYRALDYIKSLAYKNNIQTSEILKELGYDGIIADKEYVVFDSNQIKNIDNLTPTKSNDIRYSKEEITKDNKGRELSKQQQEYFKNSKAVDEDGNLKELYHGTTGGEFTIFDKTKGNVEGDFGRGLYFTDNAQDVATNYEDGGPDFDNKVSRLAERIEQEEDISYDEALEKARNQLYKGGNRFTTYLNIENPAIVGQTRIFSVDDYNEDIQSDLEEEAKYYENEIKDYAEEYDLTEEEARDEYLREQGIYDDIVNRYLEDDIENAVASVENELEMYDSNELRNLLWESVYDGGLEIEELKNKINERLEISDSNGDLANNEATRLILESLGYDGIIDNTVSNKFKNMGLSSDTTHYIVFNPNQIKNIDNTNPTEDPDIRYSKDNQTWREYLEKEFSSQGTRTNLQDINERNKPKQENKTTQEEKPQEMPKNEVKQEVKKSYLTNAEQNELDGLKAVENSGFAELTKEEQERMEELEKKSQGITKKFPELKTKNTFDDIKSIYGKYKNSEISKENNKVLNEAKNIVEANKQGRRTIEEWKQIAEYIGSNADIKNSQDLQKLAMETWFNQKPNNPQNLNRQGKKYVKFGVDDWVNAVYKGAGVGTDVKLSQEERNTINESKQDEVAVLRTPTEIQPKEVKTPEQKQEYFEESGTPKKVAKILSETPRETETSTLREKYQTLKRAVVDKGEAIYRIAKQTKNRRLYAMYDRIGLATGEGNSDIGISQTNLDGESYKNFTDSKGNKTSMSLNDIWKDIEDSNIPESVMNEYLAHYLNVDRYKPNQLSMEEQQELKELKNYKNLSKEQRETMENLEALAETKNVFGDSVTREDSLKKVKEIEEQYPQIKRPAENIWQYGKNQLQKMVDAGLVSKESQEYYNENTPHYVRLQRSAESNKGSVFDDRGHLQVNNQIKKAKGGTKDIIPFKDSMAQYTLDTTSSIRKNLFGQELSNTLKNGLETDGDIDIDNIDNNILNENEDGSYTFKIFKDGKPEILTIDKGIYEALQPNKHYELEKLFTPFKAISNFKRTVLTDKNPLFLATNFFKDFFDAPLNTKHSTVDFVKNYGVAINQILKNGEYYQKYQALGGNQNTYFDKEGFSKPGKLSKLVAPIEKANEFIELLPRMSEFITSLKKGESLDEAMYNAAEITTNFKRGGTATKIVNRNGATFLNASVQGFDKQIRNFTEIENPKQAARLLTKALVLGVAPALLNAVMYDDDDEYEDLPDYVKDSYYLFKTGKDNKWIRIPKGRAISVIQAAARRTYNYSKGDKDAYKGLAGHFENQLAPNNPLESNVLSPLVDVKNNKAWSGNKIVSDSIANASHPEEEYDAKTDELSKWLGQKLGKSPKKINYIIDQNTGAIGDLLLPFLTKQAEGEDDSVAGRLLKNPVKDKFTTDAVLNSKQVNQFYDAFNKAEDDKKWSKATDEDKLKYKYLYSTMLDLAEKNKQIKEIESSDKSDKEKYRETKAIKQEMNDMSKKAVKESENIKINDYYAQIDDKVYKKEYDKSTGEYKYTKVQQKQLDKIKDKGVPLSDYFREAYEKQKKRATK